MTRYFYISILFLLFISCHKKDYSNVSAKLDEIDSICETSPGLAAILFDSIYVQQQNMSQSDIMRLKLLKIKIEDKTENIKPLEWLQTTDSIIDYYKDSDYPEYLGETYFYAGRALSELEDNNKAELFYKNGATILENTKDYNLISKIYNQLGGLYLKQNDHKNGIEYLKLSLKNAYLDKDPSRILETENILAGSYIHIDSLKMAKDLYERIAKKINSQDSIQLKSSVLYQLIRINIQMGNISAADSLYEIVKDFPIREVEIPTVESVKYNLFKAKGNHADARKALERISTIDNWEMKRFAFRKLAEQDLRQNDISLAMTHMKSAYAAEDSVRMRISVSGSLNPQETYLSMLNSRLEDRIKEKNTLVIVLSISLAVLCIVLILLAAKLRNRKAAWNASSESFDKAFDRIYEKLEKIENRSLGTGISNDMTPTEGLMEVQKKLHAHDYRLSQSDWEAIETGLREAYPEFYRKFRGMGLQPTEWKVTLLLKMGLKKITIADVLNISQQSISSIRSRAYGKYFGSENPKASDWDRAVAES